MAARYSFTFVSYVPSHFIANTRFFEEHASFQNKKILLKQSYLLVTWFYYLSFINLKKKNLNFFILPTRRKIFTLTKAPMAHKNWSKEQYKVKVFTFKVAFKGDFNETASLGVNGSLLLLLLAKRGFLEFETNLFFLKNYTKLLTFSDEQYFNFYLFK